MAFVLTNSADVPIVGGLLGAGSSVALGFTTTVGRFLAVLIQVGGNRTISGITGACTSYVDGHPSSALGANWRVDTQAGIITSAVSSITVTPNANTADSDDRVTVLEFTGGLDPAAESGASTESVNAAANTHTAGAVTPDTAETLFLGIVRLSGSHGGFTADAQYTTLYTNNFQHAAYFIQSGATTAQDFSVATVSARNSVISCCAFRGALAAGGTANLFVGKFGSLFAGKL